MLIDRSPESPRPTQPPQLLAELLAPATLGLYRALDLGQQLLQGKLWGGKTLQWLHGDHLMTEATGPLHGGWMCPRPREAVLDKMEAGGTAH